MMNRRNLKKIIYAAIVKNKPIRVMFLLSIFFLILTFILLFFNGSIKSKIAEDEKKIEEIQQRITNLNQNIIENKEALENDEASKKKAFATYDEIVPFISLLEDLFGLLDEKTSIIIRDERDQIYSNRYADYEVKLDVGENTDFFLAALNELHKSKYITRVMNFNMNYNSFTESGVNQLKSVNFVIRLFFE